MRIAIIGAGIAGASLAYELAALGGPALQATLIEREDAPGHHATGRSAAVYLKGYGNRVIRDLTAASEAFYTAPPEGFAEAPLLTPRQALYIAREDQRAALHAFAEEVAPHAPTIHPIPVAAARELFPLLHEGVAAEALLDPDCRDLDVDAIFQGYLRGAQRLGATLRLKAEALEIERTGAGWRLRSGAESLEVDLLVNAAGAWADMVATRAGLAPLGVQPLRRTAFLVAAPEGVETKDWPMCVDADEQFYVKPQSGLFLCSPADEERSEAMDAYPDDFDVAVAVDRIQKAMDLPVRRIAHSWAGLRSFAPDRSPVMGFDPRAEGFFWVAGQGGYGIQTAPAMAKLAARAILAGANVGGASVGESGLQLDAVATLKALSPERLL